MRTTVPAYTLEKFTTFGDLLRFLRRRVGITQMELAIATGYSDAQISRLEQNLRQPDIPTIEARFVSALGLENDPKAAARLLELAATVRPGSDLLPNAISSSKPLTNIPSSLTSSTGHEKEVNDVWQAFPSGTVTFLFTDIEGSTKLAHTYAEAWESARARHHAILHDAVESNHGYVFQIIGDSFSTAFHTAGDALKAAIKAQVHLKNEAWIKLPIKIRMGIHTGAAQAGVAEEHAGGYAGYITLSFAQRVMSIGHGGQILISNASAELIRNELPDKVTLQNMGKHHLKGFPNPEQIWQVNVPGLQHEFPPLNSSNVLSNNLPVQLTSFVGREKEISGVKDALALHHLVTLIGPGGTGKTRLSLEVAMEQIGNFKNGVWLVELAPISEAAFIVSAIASVFNLREVQGVPLVNTVMDYLRAKELLLLLDNCEHLVEASAQIADQLLHTCPFLKIIASSREALGIDGEMVYRVPSLMEDEATRLFIERAVRTEPRFHMTDENASFVAQICSRLDGIPLAIELAAVRVKLFTPGQIAERLDDRFKLLTSGNHAALPRHQTLRALIDWSYDTLNETEQSALRRLSVFSGGWMFEAAEAVIGESEALDGLSGLVNKSLVNVEEQDGKSRYLFLETIRQYAMDKLVESGEASSARGRHLDYFLKFAEPAAEQLFSGKERKHWINVFELDHDNMRSALRWGLDHDPVKALKLIGFMSDFWLARGYIVEGRRWCMAALDNTEKLPLIDSNIVQIRARGFHILAFLSNNQGEHHAAQKAAEKAIALYRQVGNSKRLARSLNVYGEASAFAGDLDQALNSFRESEKISREMDYKYELSWALNSLSYIISEIHGRSAAEEIDLYMAESLALDQQIDAPRRDIRSKMFLAEQAYFRGDLEEARTYAYEILSYHQEMGNTFAYNSYKSGMAHAGRQIGNFEEALTIYRETIQEWQEFGHRGAVAHQLECFAFIAIAQEQGERAAMLLGAAEALREISNSHMTPQERIEYEKQVAGLRVGIDEKLFATLWTDGRSMTMEHAIELALRTT